MNMLQTVFCVHLCAAGAYYGIGAGVRGLLDLSAQKSPLVYSDDAMLYELWTTYKASYIEPGSGRTLDRQQNDITTSEGQSYSMLRAVWIDDKASFDSSWKWTQDFLQRPDKLFSWRYGERTDGSYGVLTATGGENAASDADSDIALSLLMAYQRWGDSDYLNQAKPIIAALWDIEVVNVAGQPVLAANNLERDSPDSIIVNPSYFSPYAYKAFAEIDPTHDWQALVANSYRLLETSAMTAGLGVAHPSGLPPNWFRMDRTSGALSPVAMPDMTTDYGYDAFRTTWRIALDWQWNKDFRARQALAHFRTLGDDWQKRQLIATVYNRSGKAIGNYESPAGYGTAIGYFKVMDPSTSQDVYTQKLKKYYSADKQTWRVPLSYYDDNWAWFGLALQLDKLPNLTEQ